MKMKLVLVHLPFVGFIVAAVLFRIYEIPMILNLILIGAVMIYGFFASRKIRQYMNAPGK